MPNKATQARRVPKSRKKNPTTAQRAAEPPRWTQRERLFVIEYGKDMNATQAAIRAGYSEKTAGNKAYGLMKKPAIRAAVDAMMATRAEKAGLSVDRVLAEIERVALFDIRKIFTAEGELLRPHQFPDDVAAAVAGLDVVTVAKGEGAVEHTAKVKMADKLKALELAGRYLGMWKDTKLDAGRVTVVFGD